MTHPPIEQKNKTKLKAELLRAKVHFTHIRYFCFVTFFALFSFFTSLFFLLHCYCVRYEHAAEGQTTVTARGPSIQRGGEENMTEKTTTKPPQANRITFM